MIINNCRKQRLHAIAVAVPFETSRLSIYIGAGFKVKDYQSATATSLKRYKQLGEDQLE